MEYLQQQHLRLLGILITHHHWDHSNGIAEIVEHWHVPVIAGAQSSLPNVSEHAADKSEIKIPGFPLSFSVLAIPGHTLDHVAYYSPGIAFTGDTLFAAGCGRVFEGTAEIMYAALQKIAALPDDTNIYCGHEYTEKNLRFAAMVEPSNTAITKRLRDVIVLREKNLPSLPALLAEEKATNPFLRCDQPEIIANVEKFAGKKLNTVVEVFYWLRKWKDGF